MNTILFIQARMLSTRLPYKAMLDLHGKPMLEHVITRCKAANVAPVIVATTMCKDDWTIVKCCKRLQTGSFMGDEGNVLHRFYKAALGYKADHVIRITGDCPMIDPEIIKDTVAYYFDQKADYCASRMDPYAYPDGMDVEIFSFDALKQAYELAETKEEREHVTPWIKDIGLFDCVQLHSDTVYDLNRFKLSVDDAKDYERAKRIFGKLYESNPLFGLEEIMEVMASWK